MIDKNKILIQYVVMWDGNSEWEGLDLGYMPWEYYSSQGSKNSTRLNGEFLGGTRISSQNRDEFCDFWWELKKENNAEYVLVGDIFYK